MNRVKLNNPTNDYEAGDIYYRHDKSDKKRFFMLTNLDDVWKTVSLMNGEYWNSSEDPKAATTELDFLGRDMNITITKG